MSDASDLRRRARGSLLGVAIGDAMGAPCEGLSAAAIHEKYGVITGFLNDDAVVRMTRISPCLMPTSS